jgi:hypothetical protein
MEGTHCGKAHRREDDDSRQVRAAVYETDQLLLAIYYVALRAERKQKTLASTVWPYARKC